MKRKEFNRLSVLAITSLLFPPFLQAAIAVSKRPSPTQRKFVSKAVDELIEEIKRNISDNELSQLFENCFPNTLDTTVFFELHNGVPDTYVITGDIDAMWQRDSSAQVNPYLPLCAKDKELSLMVEGLIRRQTRNILLDPYANAFYKDASKISQWKNDKTEMKPGVHERKWELDSLCYCIRLAHRYWKITGNVSAFNETWLQAMKLAVATMKEQQRKNDKGTYHFQRVGNPHDTLINSGYGSDVKYTGMICSAFRNSDDATTYLYNIPENLFAVTALQQLAEMIQTVFPNENFAKECLELASEVEQAVKDYGIAHHKDFGKIYAYECDGKGNYLFMEDAGIPGLITIPYLGYGNMNDEIYQRTRSFALSKDNPYFFRSEKYEGTGSPHLDWKGNMIWHLGIISRAITSVNDEEIKYCLHLLKTTHAGKGFMHEGFRKNNSNDFTRPWFAWANSYFGELILKIYADKKHLLQQ